MRILHILILAFILRLALPIGSYVITGATARFSMPDTATYVRPAQEWLATGHYATNGIPELLRPPGYPLFLTPGLLAGSLVWVTLILQIALSVLTVYLTGRIAYTLTQNPRAGRLAAGIAAVEPLGIIYTSLLLTETLFTTLLTAGLYALLTAIKKSSARPIILSGLLCAAATFVRPIGYYLPIALLIALLVARYNKRHIAAFVLLAFSLPVLWQVRNLTVADYAGFSAIADVNLYFYQSAAVRAKREGVSFYEYQNRLGYRDESVYFNRHPEQRDWTPAQRYRFMAAEGRAILLQHPLTYAAIHLKGIARTLFDPGAIDLLKLLDAYPDRGGMLTQIADRGLITALRILLQNHPIAFLTSIALGICLLAIYVCVGWALIKLPRNLPTVMLLVAAGYFTALSGGPHSLSRFRHPIMPIAAVLAGVGLAHKIRRSLQ